LVVYFLTYFECIVTLLPVPICLSISYRQGGKQIYLLSPYLT